MRESELDLLRVRNFCSVLSKKMRGRWTLGRNRSAVQGTKASGATSDSIPNSTGKKRSNDHHHTRWELGRKKGDTKSDQTTSNEYHDNKHQAAGEQEKHDDCISENPMLPQRHDMRVRAHSTNDDAKTSTGEIGNKKWNTSFLLSGISSMNHVLSRAEIDVDDDLSESESDENSIPEGEFDC